MNRGERIELLVDKTDNMANQATAFRRRTVAVRRAQWWKNQKLLVLSGVVALVRLFKLSFASDGFSTHVCLTFPCLSLIGHPLDHCRAVLWSWLEPVWFEEVMRPCYPEEHLLEG